MRPSTVRWIAIALVAALLLGAGAVVAFGGGDPPPTGAPAAAASERGARASGEFVVAHAAVPEVGVYRSRRAAAPFRTLPDPTETGAPLVFLVERRRGPWFQVLMPVRPNGSVGWVRAEEVTTYRHDYRIEVRLGERRLRAYRGERVLLDAPVAVGRRDTPTPGGRYYIKELLQPPDPGSLYGSYAYGLSGFSNVVRRFRGGRGVIGIHGTNDPSAIGTEVSRGCIRLRNEDIERLVPVLPLGTPVVIRA